MKATKEVLSSRLRSDYKFFLDYRTRWTDNDMYGHLNNSIYNLMIDSVVNAWLASEAQQQPLSSPQRGLVVRSEVNYFRSMSFPSVAELGLRINSIGKTSVQYEIGIFVQGDVEVRAVGNLIHVFVDSKTNKPSSRGLPPRLQEALKRALVETSRVAKL